MMRKNKKLVEGDQTNEWRKSGSFVNKPQRGWLHPDNAVMGPGVVYSVQVGFLNIALQYLWCMLFTVSTVFAIRCSIMNGK